MLAAGSGVAGTGVAGANAVVVLLPPHPVTTAASTSPRTREAGARSSITGAPSHQRDAFVVPCAEWRGARGEPRPWLSRHTFRPADQAGEVSAECGIDQVPGDGKLVWAVVAEPWF